MRLFSLLVFGITMIGCGNSVANSRVKIPDSAVRTPDLILLQEYSSSRNYDEINKQWVGEKTMPTSRFVNINGYLENVEILDSYLIDHNKIAITLSDKFPPFLNKFAESSPEHHCAFGIVIDGTKPVFIFEEYQKFTLEVSDSQLLELKKLILKNSEFK